MKKQYIPNDLPIFFFEANKEIIEKTKKAIINHSRKNINSKDNFNYLKTLTEQLIDATNEKFYSNAVSIDDNNKDFNDIINFVIQCCNNVGRNHYLIPDIEFSCKHFAYFKYDIGGEVKKHIHFPFTFTATVYLEVDEDSSPITFNGVDVPVKNGLCIIHPGLLRHEVKKTKSPRLVTVMHIMAKTN